MHWSLGQYALVPRAVNINIKNIVHDWTHVVVRVDC